VGSRSADRPAPARVQSHGALGRLVLRAHQLARLIGPEIAPPDLRDPVGIGVAQRRLRGRLLRQGLDELAQAERQPP